MTIALTLLIGPRSTDLVLPAHVPVALLVPELAVATGAAVHQLTTATGRRLDTSLSLLDNGVRGGAILLGASADRPVAVVDDVAQLTTDDAALGPDLRPDRNGVMLAIAVCTAAGFGIYQQAFASGAWLCLGSMLGWALAPRLVLRAYQLDASSDPAVPGIRAQLDAARQMMRRVSLGLIAGALTGAVVLVHGSSATQVVAGWLALSAVTLRVAGVDAAGSITALAAIGAAVATGVRQGGWLQGGCAAAGIAVAVCVLSRADSSPLGRLLRRAGERLLAIALPVVLVAASGLLSNVAA